MKPSQYRIIPSFKQLETMPPSERKPYLFFHIPKTAGLSFSTGMDLIYKALNESLGYPCCCARLDDISIEGEKLMVSAGEFFKRFSNGAGGFLVSHNPSRVLNRVNTQFKFITVFRDSVDRVVSAYSYQCMREQINVTDEGFYRFIRDEKNRNVSTKTLLGCEGVKGGEGVVAANMVLEYFYAYCFVKDLDSMISSILSIEGLPNIKMGQENKTLDKYRYKVTDEQRLLVESLNIEDVMLIKRVGLNSKKLPDINQDEGIHPQIVEVNGKQREQGYEASSNLRDTHEVLNELSLDSA